MMDPATVPPENKKTGGEVKDILFILTYTTYVPYHTSLIYFRLLPNVTRALLTLNN